MILPLILRTTEEALLSVPAAYREGSFGLGAGQVRTVFQIVLPTAIPGILSGVLLSIGRILGESAALLYTAGTGTGSLSFWEDGSFSLTAPLFQSTRTLSVHLYCLITEGLHTEEAQATALVLLLLVAALGALATWSAGRLSRK
jgi:phosphate transport system permease protein